MSRVTVLAAVFSVLAFFSFGGADDFAAKTARYSVAVHFDKGAEPAMGANKIAITVNDARGKPASGLQQVRIDYFMPSLSGKQPMMEKSTVAAPVGSTYESTAVLSMKGEWVFTVSIVTPSSTERAIFRFIVK